MRRAETGIGASERVGIDTGGTFTDVVAVRGGRVEAFKLPSTPASPERAVLDGLARAGAGPATRVCHGSTLATNALLERRVARVVFVTTAGFEDLIEIGRQDRPDPYALVPHRVPPLVPASRRVGIAERVSADGQVLVPLTDAALRRLVARVRRLAPEAIAIGLLHSWSRPAHERRIARALRVLGVPITLSSALCPEIREYERFATCVANACLVPSVARYLSHLDLARVGRLEVVLSHGGTAPPAQAAREPVRQLLSGPAAGLRAALAAARACGHDRVLTCDVGGTSTDAAYLGGEDTGGDGIPRRRAREVAGVPILLPALDVQTVGAGGGSIAEVDGGGALQVGPRSAGADPGPAAYGRGGPATLTDALIVLGRLPAGAIAGGALTLDEGAARRALVPIARSLGLRSVEAAALGVVRVAEARMEAALRQVSVERGDDPRRAALVAFGGAGGLHACALADALRAQAIVWPHHAGLLCAVGALTGGSQRERTRSLMVDARDRRWRDAIKALEADVRAEFEPRDRARVRCEHRALVRYRGQAHELELPATADLAECFHAAHARRYGHADPARSVEVVTVEVRGALAAPALRRPRARRVARFKGERVVVWDAGRARPARRWHRESLPGGRGVPGPAIVFDEGATLWVARGWQARAHGEHVRVERSRRP